jgi:hypothetical protein
MRWAHDREVLAVQGRNLRYVEPFGSRHDRRINRPQWEVSVPGDELGDPDPVPGVNRFGDKVPGCEVPKESDLGVRAESRLEEIGDLGHHELRYKKRSRVPLK